MPKLQKAVYRTREAVPYTRRTRSVRHAATLDPIMAVCGRRHADCYFDLTVVTCPECLRRLRHEGKAR